MKIRITFDFTTPDRKALAYRHGETRPASRDEMVAFIESTITGVWADMHDDMQHDGAAHDARHN